MDVPVFERGLLRALVVIAVGGAPAATTIGCAPPTTVASPNPAATRSAVADTGGTHESDGRGPSAVPGNELPWATFSPETFAAAKAAKKYIVMDGSAEWCHWCHVMEATTYHDPAVREVLDRSFVAIKVDIDSRPDLAERYGDYGWPATVIFAPDATELGKYRGYIAPDAFAAILREVVASGVAQSAGADPGRAAGYATGLSRRAPKAALAEETLAFIERFADAELDEYWDEEHGGWGKKQKAPLGWNNAWLLAKAEKGDATAKKRALFTLDAQAKLVDPVWGGIYQYSAANDWDHPHFEKLGTFQAPAIENYATAFRLTNEPRHLARAQAIVGYVDRFMKGPEGGFYTTQDADLNAHDRTKPFLDGHDYYALGERERLAKGIPRVDTHEYGRENGLFIAAYVTMFEATKDPKILATGETAAKRVLATHDFGKGGITHDVFDPQRPAKQRYLSDNAAVGLGLMRLFEATKASRWRDDAKVLGDFVLDALLDDEGGGLFASTKDPDAVGIFATRRVPFEENVVALRFLARLARATKEARYAIAVDRILRALGTPDEIKGRGRMLGDYLLALDETKGVRGVAK